MTEKDLPFRTQSTMVDEVSLSEESDVEDEASSSRDSHQDESSTNTGSTGRPREDGLSNEEEIKQLSARETKTIRCWRIIVLSLILAVGAAVAGGAHYFLSAQEQSQYLSGVSHQDRRECSPTRFHNAIRLTHELVDLSTKHLPPQLRIHRPSTSRISTW